MKALLMGFIAFLGFSASADWESRSKLLVDTNHQIQVAIKEGDVRCSDLGYGNMQLKISVPALKYLSSFDHTNEGELQPCMTAGRCRPGNNPEDLLAGGPGVENTVLNQKISEEVSFDSVRGECQRMIKEVVEMTVRGKTFHHTRFLSLGEHSLALCQQL